MMERFALCLKNLGRHGWRTRVILLITALGAFLSFVSENVIEDIAKKQSDMFARASVGHFRILDAKIETANTFGYYSYEPNEMLSPAEIVSVNKFLSGLSEVTGAQERIVFSGLCYGEGDQEDGINGFAMDMENYNRNFTDLYYTKGDAVRHGDADSCAASWYEYEQNKTVKVGTQYVMLLPNRNGEFVDRFITVKGGIDFRTMPKETMGFSGMFFDLDGFRTAVGYDEAVASEVVGFLSDTRDLDKVMPRIDAFLAANHPNLKAVTWREYAPIMSEIVFGFDAMMKTVETILILICVLLVFKLTTFSIIERYSEIGTMRAIGFSRSDITMQFALEGFLVIAAGALLGCLAGAGLIAVLGKTGIVNTLTFFQFIIGNGFTPTFHPDKIAAIAAIFAAVAIFAPLLPSIRGGRVTILDSLEKR